VEGLEICFEKSTRKQSSITFPAHHPLIKNAKICIFAQKHQLELMHKGIMIVINTNTTFLKSPGTTPPQMVLEIFNKTRQKIGFDLFHVY
jgi:hypothetical protein